MVSLLVSESLSCHPEAVFHQIVAPIAQQFWHAMLTFFPVLVHIQERSNSSVRTSNSQCSRVNCVDAISSFSAKKIAASRWMSCTNPYMPISDVPSVSSITDTYCRRTTSTKILNILGEIGPPWITRYWPLKVALKYPPALAIMVRWPQYLQSRRVAWWPTMYDARISRQRPWFRAS